MDGRSINIENHDSNSVVLSKRILTEYSMALFQFAWIHPHRHIVDWINKKNKINFIRGLLSCLMLNTTSSRIIISYNVRR